MDTKLTIKQIEIALHKSPIVISNPRYDIAIPNLSWGLLNHEADFVVINKSGYLTEVEIKRSYRDFIADFSKNVFHKDEKVYRFYYCIPLSIKDKVVSFFKTKEAGDKFREFYGNTFQSPGLLTYDELGCISLVKEYNYAITGFGRKLFLEERLTICRLLGLRYWALAEKVNELPKEVEQLSLSLTGSSKIEDEEVF